MPTNVRIGKNAFVDTAFVRKDIPFNIVNHVLLASHCSGDVVIPDDITNICENAFSYSGVKSVTIPQNVKYIGKNSFTSCYDLKSVTILADDVVIDDGAFSYCNNLETVTISERFQTLAKTLLKAATT